ncbi:hypothetical protein SPHV1_80020 [Novosphingobium sp. KN65.2]|nr:hypothetical protein SPHV1_80020 [Novosphingobium sp. KN65.2]
MYNFINANYSQQRALPEFIGSARFA